MVESRAMERKLTENNAPLQPPPSFKSTEQNKGSSDVDVSVEKSDHGALSEDSEKVARCVDGKKRRVEDAANNSLDMVLMDSECWFEPSVNYLIQKFQKQFSPMDSSIAKLSALEDEEVEELYQNLRKRERTEVILCDYYRTTTEYAELIHEQRLLTVDWIVEESAVRPETKFLGVGLLDRFLREGFFKSERELQILGIACLLLAIKLEEAYCGIREKSEENAQVKFPEEFQLGKNVYKRCEVAVMEWLVLCKLNFNCSLTTVYNFLWFYLKAAKANKEVEERATQLALLALSRHEMLGHWPSTIAAGVVILALRDSYLIGPERQVIKVLMLFWALVTWLKNWGLLLFAALAEMLRCWIYCVVGRS